MGFESREFLELPGVPGVVSVGHAYDWNPTIAGSKMEDTILVGAQSNDIMTTIPGWPVISIQVLGLDVEVRCALALELIG